MLSDEASGTFSTKNSTSWTPIAFDGFLGDEIAVNFAWKPFFNVYAREYGFLRILERRAYHHSFPLALSDSSPLEFR